MAFKRDDLLRQSSTSTGSTSLALTIAAVRPYRNFSAVMANNDTIDAMVINTSVSGEWQLGRYRYDSATTSLVLVRMIRSSTGSTITFTAGAKDIQGALVFDRDAEIVKTANYTAADGDVIAANTLAGAWTLTLPASLGLSARIVAYDQIGTWPDKPLVVTVTGGGTINGVADNLSCDMSARVTFLDTATGWKVEKFDTYIPFKPRWNFMTPGVMPVGAILSRPGNAWYFDAVPSLQQASTNQQRWTYDPVSGSLQGMHNEIAGACSLPNNSGVGTVAGSPGTAPTGWVIQASALGITRTIVGVGTEDGIPYFDIQLAGSPTTTSFSVQPCPNIGIAAATGQVFTFGAYARVVAGNLTNISSILLAVSERDSGGAIIGANTSTQTITPGAGALKTQRFNLSRTMAAGTVANVTGKLQVNVNSDGAHPINVTLRMFFQLEATSAPTSPIVTTTVALARSADVLTIPLPSRTYSSIRITRSNGVQTLTNVVVTGNSYTVPASVFPLQFIEAFP